MPEISGNVHNPQGDIIEDMSQILEDIMAKIDRGMVASGIGIRLSDVVDIELVRPYSFFIEIAFYYWYVDTVTFKNMASTKSWSLKWTM